MEVRFLEIDRRTLENIIDLPTSALIDLFKKNLRIANDSNDTSMRKSSESKAYTAIQLAAYRGSEEAKELIEASFGFLDEQQIATDKLTLEIIVAKIIKDKEVPQKTVENLKPVEGLFSTRTSIPLRLSIEVTDKRLKANKSISGYVNLYADIVMALMVAGAGIMVFFSIGEPEWLRAFAYSLDIPSGSFRTFVTIFQVTLAGCILINGVLNYIFIKAIARIVEASEILIAMGQAHRN